MHRPNYCVLCKTEFTRAKPEHILLNALGGRMTSGRVLCSECNAQMGSGPDAEFAADVKVLRNLANWPSGDGSPAPTLKNVEANSLNTDLLPGGVPKLRPNPALSFNEKPDGKIEVAIQANSVEQLDELIPHIAGRVAKPIEEVRKRLLQGGKRISLNVGPTHEFSPSFGTEGAQRSMAKACMALWATAVGTEELAHSDYDELRDFACTGDFASGKPFVWLDCRQLPDATPLSEYGQFPTIIWVESDSRGRVLGHFRLYQLCGWTFRLRENAAPPNRRIGLIANPEDPSQWSKEFAETSAINFEWLNQSDDSFRHELAVQEASSDFLKYVHDRQVNQAIGSAVEEAFRLVDRDEIDVAKEPELFRKLVNYAAFRVAHIVARMPHQIPINNETIRAMKRGKN